MTNKEILTNFEKLYELRERSTMRFPARVSFAIVRNLRIMQPIYDDIVATRVEVLQKYGEPVAGKLGCFVPKIGKEEIMKEELDAIDKAEPVACMLQGINFSDIENLDLSIADMDALDFMLAD